MYAFTAVLAVYLGPTDKRRQRLAKWFTTLSPREKAKIVKDVSQLVLARRTRMCNFLEYKGESPIAAQSPNAIYVRS